MLNRRSLLVAATSLVAETTLGVMPHVAFAQSSSGRTIRIGFQKSSTLIALLKESGELEKAIAPLGVKLTWHEFTSGLPLLEAINTGNVDFGADVADTVPLFAQAAGAKLAYIAEEAASPSAQAILVPEQSTIRSVADLRGKKVAVTKGAGSHLLLLAALKRAGVSFAEITPAYLTPADGRTAFVGGNVDAWVAWDPFLTSAVRQSKARVLADGSGGLASYKRYYLASATFADNHDDLLKLVFKKLVETGSWIKREPKAAATTLAGLWGIQPDIVEEANSHRSYAVGEVTRVKLTEQQLIADEFFAANILPRRIDASDVRIWSPSGSKS